MRIPLRNLIASGTVLLIAACNSSTPPTPAPAANEQAGHDHSHEELGPHGGHLVELGDEEYHLEWTHDDATGLITLYVLDGAAKEPVPVALETITITAQVTDSTEYQLTAVEPGGDPPASARFELKSPELIECLKLAGQGAEVSIALAIDGKDYRGVFEHHDHAHHH